MIECLFLTMVGVTRSALVISRSLTERTRLAVLHPEQRLFYMLERKNATEKYACTSAIESTYLYKKNQLTADSFAVIELTYLSRSSSINFFLFSLTNEHYGK